MILPTTNINFGSLADQATSTFFNNPGTTLKEEVTKIAKQNNLNPEEIKRLVEHTNISTTKKVLASVKDRRAEFEVVDSKEVLASTHTNTETEDPELNKEASILDDFTKLADTQTSAYEKASEVLASYSEGLKKVAYAQEVNSHKALLHTFFAMRKEKNELEMKKMASEINVKDNIDFLLSEFSKYYTPDFSKFANEAYTLHGETVRPIIASIQNYLDPKIKVTPSSFEKVAYVVDDTTKLLQKLAEVKDNLLNLVAINKRLFELNNKLPK